MENPSLFSISDLPDDFKDFSSGVEGDLDNIIDVINEDVDVDITGDDYEDSGADLDFWSSSELGKNMSMYKPLDDMEMSGDDNLPWNLGSLTDTPQGKTQTLQQQIDTQQLLVQALQQVKEQQQLQQQVIDASAPQSPLLQQQSQPSPTQSVFPAAAQVLNLCKQKLQQQQLQQQQLQLQQQQQLLQQVVEQQQQQQKHVATQPIKLLLDNTQNKQVLVVVPPNSSISAPLTWTSQATTVPASPQQLIIQPALKQEASPTAQVTVTSPTQVSGPITTATLVTPATQVSVPISTEFSSTSTGTAISPSVNKIPINPVKTNIFQPEGICGKGEKRTSHNAIEKRYRKSINERIETLKQMVVGCGAKIQKSGILQKAIDHIKYLRRLANQLKQENKELRAQIENLKGAASVTNTNIATFIKHEPLTPPLSDVSSPASHHEEEMLMEAASPKQESNGLMGMTDRGRFTLCIFMFAILMFNPFGFLLGKAVDGLTSQDMTYQHALTGRSLLATNGEGEINPLVRLGMSSTVWIVNLVLIIGFLMQMLIRGEPVTRPCSEAAEDYWRHRQQAEVLIKKNEHRAALLQIQHSLKALGRTIPISPFDMWACGIWNFLRFFLNKIFIGRWMAKRAGGNEKNDSENGKYTIAETSARDAAIMYLKFMQMRLISNQPKSALGVTSIGLLTINLAHCAGTALGCESMAEIYATVALAIKDAYPKRLKFISRYFFSKGKTYAKEYNIPAYLFWMNDLRGYSLVKSEELGFKPKQTLFSKAADPSNPLSCLNQDLQELMLEGALFQIVAPSEKSIYQEKYASKSENVLEDALQTLSYLENSDGKIQDHDEAKDLCVWWSKVLLVAVYWMLGDDDGAQRRYDSLRDLPPELQASDDSLPKATLYALKARKLLLFTKGENFSDECHALCYKASKHLSRSLTYSGPLKNTRLYEGMQLLVTEWLLATRTTLWQHAQGESPTTILASQSELSMFQQDLANLRRIAVSIKSITPKVHLYEAVTRFMAGANPSTTQQLLDRSLRKKITNNNMYTNRKENTDFSVSERDRAQAIMMACRHLPSSMLSYPNQKERMLAEAARCLEIAGDKRGLQDCQNMLQSLQRDAEEGEELKCQGAALLVAN